MLEVLTHVDIIAPLTSSENIVILVKTIDFKNIPKIVLFNLYYKDRFKLRAFII